MSSLARVEVLNTGTELLFGSVINTHLSFLGQQLFPLGLRVQRQVTVPDGDAIRDAILESANRCDMILLTGGLGPTSDDITREIVAELTRRPLQYDDRIFQKIRERFERRGLKLTDRISRQAYVPEGAAVLTNDFGTAPGLYLPARTGIPHLFLFPGPPRELQPMFNTYALPILQNLAGNHDLHARIFRTTGLGESYIEKMVGDQLLAIPGLELGYCARLGEVDIRIIGSRSAVHAAEEIIRSELARYIIATEEKELEDVIVQLLSATTCDVSDRRILYRRIAGEPCHKRSRILGRFCRRKRHVLKRCKDTNTWCFCGADLCLRERSARRSPGPWPRELCNEVAPLSLSQLRVSPALMEAQLKSRWERSSSAWRAAHTPLRSRSCSFPRIATALSACVPSTRSICCGNGF